MLLLKNTNNFGTHICYSHHWMGRQMHTLSTSLWTKAQKEILFIRGNGMMMPSKISRRGIRIFSSFIRICQDIPNNFVCILVVPVAQPNIPECQMWIQRHWNVQIEAYCVSKFLCQTSFATLSSAIIFTRREVMLIYVFHSTFEYAPTYLRI